MKKNKISLWYDKDGDYLEITLRKSKDTYFNEIKKDFAEIIDMQTKEIIGYAVFNFMKQKRKQINLEIPTIA